MNAIEIIKQNLNIDIIIQLLSHFGARYITVIGNTIRCTCPIHHGDNKTAFVWNIDNNLWYCHTHCKQGGDIIDFIIAVEHMPPNVIKDATMRVAELLGISLQNATSFVRTKQDTVEILEWMNRVIPEVNQPFDGLILGGLINLSSFRNLTAETIEYFTLKHSDVYDSIVAPIHNESGIQVAANIRYFHPQNPDMRWQILPKGFKKTLEIYNLHRVLQTEEYKNTHSIYLVEGASDVWNIHQLGIPNVGATLGSSLSQEQAQLLMKYFTTVYIMYDNDAVGIEGKNKIITALKDCMTLIECEYPSSDPGELEDKDFISYKIVR